LVPKLLLTPHNLTPPYSKCTHTHKPTGTGRSLALLWLAVARAIGLPLVPWSYPGDGILLKLQLPACSGGAYLADPSNPGQLLVLPDYSDNESSNDGGYNSNSGYSASYDPAGYAASGWGGDAGTSDAAAAAPGMTNNSHNPSGDGGWVATMAVPGAQMGGMGVKVLGPGAAAELSPMAVRRLLSYALMDVKRTYLMTGLMEDALGMVR